MSGSGRGGEGCCEGTHWKRQTGRPIELRDGHFEVTEVVELTQRQRGMIQSEQHKRVKNRTGETTGRKRHKEAQEGSHS